VEYNEPTAQNIELRVNDIIPTKLNELLPVKGFTRIIRPENPATNPKTIFFVKCCLYIVDEIIATHKGIVEFNRAIIPEERY
jgi:hypothetical protein